MKRQGTTSPPPAGKAKTQAAKKTGGGAQQNGTRRIGSREFTRRALTTERKRAVKRSTSTNHPLSAYVERLPSFSVGGLLRGIPRAALVCALVAILNAACWSFISPPFETPDEPDHFAYVKQIAETGRLPTSTAIKNYSIEEFTVLEALEYFHVRQQPETHAISSQAQERRLAAHLREGSESAGKGSESAGVATSEPPLYYALQAIPYTFAGGNLLDRLALMRLFSALMAGLTALFVFLFLREVLPETPWAWTTGALAVALVPLLGLMSGAVNPDSMLFAVSAALFYAFGRAFRRGFARPDAIAIGALLAIGLMTKLNFVGLVPGALLGLVILSVRCARLSARRQAVRLLALALAIAFSPVLVYVAVKTSSHHSPLALVTDAINSPHGYGLGELNYIWQLYLPRIPGTVNDFPGIFPARQLWFRGYVGLYGWLDTTFPGWVYAVALVPAGAIALLCIRELARVRAVLRGRAAELVVYAAVAIGLMVFIGASSYRAFPTSDEFAQTRYLLPLLPLFGAVLALAARGAGRRWGPAAGTLIVVLFLAHDLFSQLQTIGRFYG